MITDPQANTERQKIIVIFIAYKAKHTLENFYSAFPKQLVDEVILVDDASGDGTFELAQKLGITSFENPVNLGYGGNMKRAIEIALSRGADIIIDIHPDGEYKPSAIPEAIQKVKEGALLVLGNRFTHPTAPLQTGMYIWKLIPITILNWIDRAILGLTIGDFHQGFRVYTRTLLESIPFKRNSNNYLFSFELIAQAAFKKMNVAQVPVETSYTGEKRGASLKNSIKYSLGTFTVLALFILAKSGLKNKLFR
ncbi:MAG: glycosyltransferase family 2 protein [Candidatus Taylorbacteria bacterium]|nr:glycosyltransferase family 2 protein [Candidatus Taylorbacteria bacterium]